MLRRLILVQKALGFVIRSRRFAHILEEEATKEQGVAAARALAFIKGLSVRCCLSFLMTFEQDGMARGAGIATIGGKQYIADIEPGSPGDSIYYI